MGFLDKLNEIAGSLGREHGHNPSLINGITDLIRGQGIRGIIDRFTQRGLEDRVRSWVGRGSNRPITNNEVREVFEEDEIRNIANESGVSEDEAVEAIKRVLPDAIDRATPNGTVDEDDDSADDEGSDNTGTGKE